MGIAELEGREGVAVADLRYAGQIQANNFRVWGGGLGPRKMPCMRTIVRYDRKDGGLFPVWAPPPGIVIRQFKSSGTQTYDSALRDNPNFGGEPEVSVMFELAE